MKKRIALSSLLSALGFVSIGCSRSPTIDVAGSFFPSWMICLIAGIAIAILLRTFLAPRKLDADIGPLAIFYPAISLFLACLLWLISFS
jgi:hypothetical protein